MSNIAKIADASTFQKLCGAITPEPSIRSSWIFVFLLTFPCIFKLHYPVLKLCYFKFDQFESHGKIQVSSLVFCLFVLMTIAPG